MFKVSGVKGLPVSGLIFVDDKLDVHVDASHEVTHVYNH
jgi:hypothetical protein